MKKIDAIIYTSYAGHTKEYAELLGGITGIPVFDLKQSKGKIPTDANIIYMGWLMAGQVKGIRDAAKQFRIAAVCGVGMARGGTQIDDIRRNNSDIPADVPVFTLQGGFEMDKLHGLYKLMMKTMQKTAAKNLSAKPDRTPEEEETLDLLLNGANLVSADGLAEILDWCKG